MLAAAYFFAFAANGLNVPLATPALLQAGFAASLIGGLASMRSLLQMFATPLWAAIADATGTARAMAIRGQLSVMLAMVILAYATSSPMLVAGYFLFGFLAGGSTTLIDSLNIMTHDRHRFGLIRLFGTIGYAAAILVTGQLRPLDQKEVFLSAAAFSALAAVSMIGPKTPRVRTPIKLWANGKTLMRDPTFAAVTLMAAFQWASHSAFTVFMVPLGKARGAPLSVIAYAIVIGLGIEIVCMRYSGALYRRFGGRNLLLITAGAGVIRWGGLALTHDVPSFLLLHALHGISFGMFYPTIVTATAGVTSQAQRVTGQALLTSVGFGLGGAIGAALAGLTFDRWGADATWAIMLVPAGLASALALFAPGIKKLV